MYVDEKFGSWQTDKDPQEGAVQFKIFIPDNSKDPSQYVSRRDPSGNPLPSYGDPRIKSVQVVGDFQGKLGQSPWDPAAAPHMQRGSHPKGWAWTYTTPARLPAGFYEYKYLVTFDDGFQRWVSDPCCRYGGRRNQNAGIVVGGSHPDAVPLGAGQRKHLRDLVQYEIHIDDFTGGYRGADAPIKAVCDKLPYLTDLGVNALAIMPWTAWPGEGYSWGYTPYLYYSVEQYYTEHLNASDEPNPVPVPSAERLSWLKTLVTKCHQAGIHVIMDGVFNHVGCADFDPRRDSGDGFPYPWFYRNPADCPYVGQYGGCFDNLKDLDYNNGCTQEFIGDACLYWIDEFKVDGIRLDNTTNFYIAGDLAHGLPKLIQDVRQHVASKGLEPFALILEHLDMSAADVTNVTGATSYWNNALYQCCFDHLWNGWMSAYLIGALNNHLGLQDGKVATTYISNHDHSHLAWRAGARNDAGSMESYRIQPYLIAMFTAPGSPLIQSGTEFGQDFWIPEDDKGTGRRVRFRPLQWEMADDKIGKGLLDLHRPLIALRRNHASLRSDNFYPSSDAGNWPHFAPDGYGVNVDKGVVIYHRWGKADDGRLERFIIVLNFSDRDQWVDIPFSVDGTWQELLNGGSASVSGCRLYDQQISRYWGRVYFNVE